MAGSFDLNENVLPTRYQKGNPYRWRLETITYKSVSNKVPRGKPPRLLETSTRDPRNPNFRQEQGPAGGRGANGPGIESLEEGKPGPREQTAVADLSNLPPQN